VWKWVNLGVLRVSVNSAEARKSILSVYVHGARSTNTLSARPSEGECGVDFVFDFYQRVENLLVRFRSRTALREDWERGSPWARIGSGRLCTTAAWEELRVHPDSV